MIKSFKDKDSSIIFQRQFSRRLPVDIQRTAARKLYYLDNAESLSDLGKLPGNRLEALKGDRVGQHSVRINNQYRICFVWSDGDAYDVEITDYH